MQLHQGQQWHLVIGAEQVGRGRGQVRYAELNVPLTRSMAKPSTLVWPDFQNTAAMEKRAIKAIKLWGMRCMSAIAYSIQRRNRQEVATGVFMAKSREQGTNQ